MCRKIGQDNLTENSVRKKGGVRGDARQLQESSIYIENEEISHESNGKA